MYAHIWAQAPNNIVLANKLVKNRHFKIMPKFAQVEILVYCRESSKLSDGTMEYGGLLRPNNYFWAGRPKICLKMGQKFRLMSKIS